MRNHGMLELSEIFQLQLRHQRRRMSSIAVQSLQGVPHAAAPPLPLACLHTHQLTPAAVQPSGF